MSGAAGTLQGSRELQYPYNPAPHYTSGSGFRESSMFRACYGGLRPPSAPSPPAARLSLLHSHSTHRALFNQFIQSGHICHQRSFVVWGSAVSVNSGFTGAVLRVPEAPSASDRAPQPDTSGSPIAARIAAVSSNCLPYAQALLSRPIIYSARQIYSTGTRILKNPPFIVDPCSACWSRLAPAQPASVH